MGRFMGRQALGVAAVVAILLPALTASPANALMPAKARPVIQGTSEDGLVMARRPIRITVRGASSATLWIAWLDYSNYSNPWAGPLDWSKIGVATPKRGPRHTFSESGYYAMGLLPVTGQDVVLQVPVYDRFSAGYELGPTVFGGLILAAADYVVGDGTTDSVEAEDGCRFVDVGAKTDYGSVTVSIRSEKANPVSFVATPGAPVAATRVRVGGSSYVSFVATGDADDETAVAGSVWTCTHDPFPYS